MCNDSCQSNFRPIKKGKQEEMSCTIEKEQIIFSHKKKYLLSKCLNNQFHGLHIWFMLHHST